MPQRKARVIGHLLLGTLGLATLWTIDPLASTVKIKLPLFLGFLVGQLPRFQRDQIKILVINIVVDYFRSSFASTRGPLLNTFG